MLNTTNIPKHVAFIMDGNRRYARMHHLDLLQGHVIGEKRIEPLVDYAMELGIPYLSFWAFSTENWKRRKKEVSFLLSLFRKNLDKRVDSFHKKNVRMKIIGDLSKFPEDIQKKVKRWIEKTKDNTRITVIIALSYGGHDEIVRAVNRWLAESKRKDIFTRKDMEVHLDTYPAPEPDLLIRTGGAMRLSGFMSWQIAYTELYFTKVFWPEFTPEHFKKALAEYQKRQRRFGK